MPEYWKRLTSKKDLLIKLLVASFFVNILALATPIYVIQVLQRYVAYGVTSTLVTLVMGISFIVVFEFFFRNIRHRMAREYELDNVMIANSVLDKLIKIKSHIYETATQLRNDRINKNLSTIQSVYTATGALAILDVPFTLIFIFALFLIHYQLGIITIIFLAIPFFLNKYYREKIGQFSIQNDLLNGNLFRIFDNIITRNITIKFFNLIKPVSSSWNIVANNIANNRENLESQKNITTSLTSGISAFLTVFVIGWGAVLAVDGQISVGALIGANILASRALMPVIRFTQMQESIAKGSTAFKEINSFLNFANDRAQGRVLKDTNAEIELSNVGFIYPANKNPVFENLSFRTSPGTLTLITGFNGSGKSTLIKLVANILDISRGQISLDKIDLNQLSLPWYRNLISYAPQEPTFIDGTLGENIVGANQIDEKKLIETLKQVDLLNYVNSHESGINMQLENRGESLPLGIRKRIGLARSIINEGKVILFDEPLEGLDENGLKAITKLIEKFKTEKKTVIIASNYNYFEDLANVIVNLGFKPKPLVSIKK